MPDGYVPVRTRPSDVSVEQSLSLTDTERDLVHGRDGLLHLRCSIWKAEYLKGYVRGAKTDGPKDVARFALYRWTPAVPGWWVAFP